MSTEKQFDDDIEDMGDMEELDELIEQQEGHHARTHNDKTKNRGIERKTTFTLSNRQRLS